tara:strand:+ start:17343 stop:18158 length:816 start_codon:yes stop_codon:yes gene_type:complete
MKISNSIGMTGGQQNTLAAVLGGLNYEYTWAFDFSKITAVTQLTNFNGNFTESGSGIFDDGVRAVANFTSTSTAGFAVDESLIPTNSHSNGSAGSEIPDAAIPDPVTATGSKVAADDSGVIGHPGRYVSIVCTYHKYDIDSSHSAQPTSIGLQSHTEGSAGQIWWYGNYDYVGVFNEGRPTYLNGVANPPEAQADYDAIIGDVSILTYDYVGGFVNGDPSADPLKFNILPALDRILDIDITFHGLILSNVPPEPITLPVEITNPTIGSGPA